MSTFYYYEVAGACTDEPDEADAPICAFPAYQAPPGVTAKLRPVNQYGGDVGGYDLFTRTWHQQGNTFGRSPWDDETDVDPHETFDFPGFILTLADGTEFYLPRDHQGDFNFLAEEGTSGGTTQAGMNYVSAYGQARLKEIRQRSGDKIVIGADSFVDGQKQFSVAHYNASNALTRALYLTRDDKNRIVEIRDPISGSSGVAVVKYEYDNANNLAKVLKLVNRSTGSYLTNQYFYEYSKFPHYLTKIIDSRGNQVARNLYDDDGRLIGVIDASGRTNRFEHDLANHREIQFDRKGYATTNEYDLNGNIIRHIDPLGRTNSYQYDVNGYLAVSTDPAGNTTSYTHDENGNLLSITAPYPSGADPNAYSVRYTYGQFGEQITKVSPTGSSITNIYDAQGRLVEIHNESGQTLETITYDALGQVATEEDGLGRTVFYYYDSLGNVTNIAGPNGGGLTNSFDANGNLTNCANAKGVGSVEYDAQNRQIAVNAGTGLTLSFTIGADTDWTELSSTTVGSMKRTFDEQGRLAAIKSPNGATNAYCYDANGNIEFHTNEIGQVTQYVYDQAGREIFATNLTTGAAESFIFDVAGNILQEMDALGNTTRYTYNPDGGVASMSNALGNGWTYFYDIVASCCGGNNAAVTETDPFGRQKVKINSARGLPLQMIYRSGSASATNTLTYWSIGENEDDPEDNYVETITDEGGHTRRFYYTVLGQMERATDLGGVNFWTNQYDEATTILTNVVGPTGEHAFYTHDEFENVNTIRFPDGNWLTNTYNSVNLLEAVRLPSGESVEFFYDSAGRLTNRTSTIGENVAFNYNQEDEITTMQDSTGRTTNLYNADGQLHGIDFPNGANVRYSYDLLRRVTRLEARTGVGFAYTNHFAYDPVGNLTNVSCQLNGQTFQTRFEYDRANRKTKRVLPNGIITTYQYDWRDRLTNITHKTAGGVVLASAVYERQGIGEPAKVTREDGSYVLEAVS